MKQAASARARSARSARSARGSQGAPGKDAEVTPDGRYLVVRGRLWRCSNPALPPTQREKLVAELMDARREVGRALRTGDKAGERAARARVNAAKVALGERGPVWWDDGAADYNRYLVKNTPYAAWHEASAGRQRGRTS